MRSIITGFLAFLMVCTLAAGAQAMTSAEQQAVDTSLAWLTLVDQDNYEQSWQEAASYFKNVVKQAQWASLTGGVRKQLGAVISRKAASATAMSSMPGAPDGEYWVILFNTTFKNKKQAVETVTLMKDKDGKWRAVGYFIR